MRSRRSRVFCAGLTALIVGLVPQLATAEVGPGPGSGSRAVSAERRLLPASPAPAGSSTAAKSHRVGRAPNAPKSTLPEGMTAGSPDGAARRLVAQGATDEELAGKVSDPELQALEDAERVLFPKAIEGVRPGWSWDFPGGPKAVPQAGNQAAEPRALEEEWLRSLSMPNIPVRMDERVIKYLRFYRDTKRGRAIGSIWARKIGRYTAALKAEFARHGLPSDLVWLSLIESGHNPNIRSPAGAAGLWQFMPDSGRMYGLTVDRWVDERLNPQRATVAAARYLSDLHRRFGNWDLAMAAYNMGHNGLTRSVRKFNTNDFWRLGRFEAGIPWETTLYVPKILAIAVVMNNKKAFGLHKIKPDAAVSFDVVYANPGVPLADVARASGVAPEAIAALNPQYLAGRTPPSSGSRGKKRWRVHVPRGSGQQATRALAKRSKRKKFNVLTARFGDTIASIAGRARTSAKALRRLNRLGSSERMAKGTILMVPKSGSVAPAPSAPIVVPAQRFQYPGRDRVFYQVLSGDSLPQIAGAFGVSEAEVLTYNSLDKTAGLQAKMVLQIFVPKGRDLSGVRYSTPADSRVLIAGTKTFFDHFEGLRGRERLTVSARAKDTLTKIGRRYGMSSGMMERINRHSRRRQLSEGEPVVVYTKKGRVKSARRVPVPARPLPPVRVPDASALPRPSVATASPAQ